MNRKLILAAMALLIAGGVAWVSVSQVSAQTSPVNSVVQKLAAKFGLKEADVQSVFDTEHQEHQDQMQKLFAERLTQAVKDGKITEAQKHAILARHSQMQTRREADRSEWQTWLKANNLENVDLGFGFGGHMKIGRGMHGW